MATNIPRTDPYMPLPMVSLAILFLLMPIACRQAAGDGETSSDDGGAAEEGPVSVAKSGGEVSGGGGMGGAIGPAGGVAVPIEVPQFVPPKKAPRSAVYAGFAHTCATKSDGTIKCWGYNSAGQLGLGLNAIGTDSAIPTAPLGLADGIVEVAPGRDYTCALTVAGAVICWGSNASGQISAPATPNVAIPTRVEGLDKVASVSAGFYHTCAILQSGIVECWGLNNKGQTGQGHFEQVATRGEVKGLSRVVSISAGFEHTCALDDEGGVYCWGSNEYGRIGDGTQDNRNSPVPVDIGGRASQVSVGPYHTCALLVGGTVKCWGRNNWGMLGDGTKEHRALPTPVIGLQGRAIAISSGGSHTCALLENGGGVSCWGYAGLGQIGPLGTSLSQSEVPLTVTGLSGEIDQLSVGLAHNCVLPRAGGVVCWGANNYKQLGSHNGSSSATPVTLQNYN